MESHGGRSVDTSPPSVTMMEDPTNTPNFRNYKHLLQTSSFMSHLQNMDSNKILLVKDVGVLDSTWSFRGLNIQSFLGNNFLSYCMLKTVDRYLYGTKPQELGPSTLNGTRSTSPTDRSDLDGESRCFGYSYCSNPGS